MKALLFANCKARADREDWRFGPGGRRERVGVAPATAVRVVAPEKKDFGYVSKTYSCEDNSAARALCGRLEEFYRETRSVPGVEHLRSDKAVFLVDEDVIVPLEPVGVTRKPADVAEAILALRQLCQTLSALHAAGWLNDNSCVVRMRDTSSS